jgi:hypothetical protein
MRNGVARRSCSIFGISTVCCIFCFGNLVSQVEISMVVYIFSFIDFPLLRTLRLNKVYILEQRFRLGTLSGCPIVEDFEVKNIFIAFYSDKYDQEVNSLTNLVRANISNLM